MVGLSNGAILIILGYALIVFRKPYSEAVIDFQIRAFHMPFGKREVKISIALAWVIGIVVIAAGILALLGVTK